MACTPAAWPCAAALLAPWRHQWVNDTGLECLRVDADLLRHDLDALWIDVLLVALNIRRVNSGNTHAWRSRPPWRHRRILLAPRSQPLVAQSIEGKEILEQELDVRIILRELVEPPEEASAVRALEVGKLDDGVFRRVRPV